MRVLLLLVAAAALAAPAATADDEPFELLAVRVAGRPLYVEGLASGWLAVSVTGQPPEERRQISVFARGADGALPGEPTRVLEVPREVVAFDVAGDQIVLLSAAGIEVHAARGDAPPRRVPLPGRPPLPPRLRELSRTAFVDAWNGDGRPAALVPSDEGAWIVDLANGDGGGEARAPRHLPLPLVTEYATQSRSFPAHDEVLTAETVWPALSLGDDDGDGRPDLFAVSRYDVWIYRNGEDGLPAAPTRKLALRPFSLAEEMRHDTTALRAFARDLNGDGLADLFVDVGTGTLGDSRHETRIHLNGGSGVELDGGPRVSVEEGIAAIRLHDVDGDGTLELLQARITFGILQLVRLLVTRRADVQLRLYRLDGDEAWGDDVSLVLDFDSGRSQDLIPTAEGDWNGDGLADLLYGEGGDELRIRLGEVADGRPGFGRLVGRQPLPVPGASEVEIADVDGDGLDDLVLCDSHDLDGRIFVLRNRGILPGTRPGLRRAQD